MRAPVAVRLTVTWPAAVDEIIGGDLVAAVGVPTSRGGIALSCVCPIGLRDRHKGTVSFTSPLGFGRKLVRIADNPRIAVAYHTRQHGRSDLPGYVLVQGTASIAPIASKEWFVEQVMAYDERLLASRHWDRWLKAYYADRALVTVQVERIVWWPEGDMAGGHPVVLGEPLAASPPPSQDPPRDADRPRTPMRPIARSTRRGHRLIGVLLEDGLPLVLPFDVVGASRASLSLKVDSSLLPRGDRRAGLVAHGFCPQLAGLRIATHTGWLSTTPSLRWVPHTRHVLYSPPSRLLCRIGSGLATRWRHGEAVRVALRLGLRVGTPADQRSLPVPVRPTSTRAPR